jgi:hypothetical protein
MDNRSTTLLDISSPMSEFDFWTGMYYVLALGISFGLVCGLACAWFANNRGKHA